MVTGEMVEELILSGADIIKVGVGPGKLAGKQRLCGGRWGMGLGAARDVARREPMGDLATSVEPLSFGSITPLSEVELPKEAFLGNLIGLLSDAPRGRLKGAGMWVECEVRFQSARGRRECRFHS